MIKNRIIQKTPQEYLTETLIEDLNSFYSQEIKIRHLRRKGLWPDWKCKEFKLIIANQISDFLGIMITFTEERTIQAPKIIFEKNDFGIGCKASFDIPGTGDKYIMQYSAKINNEINYINKYNLAYAKFLLDISNPSNEASTDDLDRIFHEIHIFMAKHSAEFLSQR